MIYTFFRNSISHEVGEDEETEARVAEVTHSSVPGYRVAEPGFGGRIAQC